MALYDLGTLLEVLRVQKTSAPAFWITYFPRQINFDTPKIMFDKVFGDDRQLAPFVVPNVQGRPQRLEGYETVSFAPAYTKIKDVVSAEMHVERMAGEAIFTGSLSIEQRRDAVIGYLLGMQLTKHRNRLEWLAAKAIIDGKVTISGEDYPSTLVDFRRHADLTITLSGAALWSAGTADPLADIKSARLVANDKSGARTTKVIFGQTAWDHFAARVNLKEMMNVNFGGLNTTVTLMTDGYEGVEYMGVIQGLNGSGRIEAWVNTSKYVEVDADGVKTEQFYLPQNKVVGVSDMVQGIRCFGAIMDKKAGYRALETFVKNWENEDPSVEYLLFQSAPLMVPKQPDATWCMTVSA